MHDLFWLVRQWHPKITQALKNALSQAILTLENIQSSNGIFYFKIFKSQYDVQIDHIHSKNKTDIVLKNNTNTISQSVS